MTQVCKPKSDDVTLEIGTGSGFQSALLSRIVKRAYSIEIIEPLGKAVSKIFTPLGYTNVHTRVGDGYYGWPEVQGGFDIIIVTCAAKYAPPDLFKQMKPGGRLVSRSASRSSAGRYSTFTPRMPRARSTHGATLGCSSSR